MDCDTDPLRVQVLVGRSVRLPDWLWLRLCLWLGLEVAVNDREGEVADEVPVNVRDGVPDCRPDVLRDWLGEVLCDWLRLQVRVDALRVGRLPVRETVRVGVVTADTPLVGVGLPDGDGDLVGRLTDCVPVPLRVRVWVGETLGLGLVLVVRVRLSLRVAVPLPLGVALGE